MSVILLLALAVNFAEPEKLVTDDEKKAFLELLTKLPAKGEFFTDEAIKKALPHTRVLLALTEKDIEKYDIYPFLALSSGLLQHKEARESGLKDFGKIAHPMIKMGWAVGLFDAKAPSPAILDYLRKALDSNEDSKLLASMLGPGFEGFKDRVTEAAEVGKKNQVELVKRHTIEAFPAYSEGHDYTDREYIFAPGQMLFAIRPQDHGAELLSYSLADGKLKRVAIPQPKEFKPKSESHDYFEDPTVRCNSRGDLLFQWTLEGNGDHAIALLKKGSDSVKATRVRKYLMDSFLVANPDGTWFVIEGSPHFTVHQLDDELNFTEIGSYSGKGFHSSGGIVDARFISKDVLHLFWEDVLSEGNNLRMQCVDFDVKNKKWLHAREVFRLDKFVSSANRPTVLQLKDDSLHYFWKVDQGAEGKQGAASGLYYQAEADGKTIKLSTSYDGYRAIAIGDRIVVCYTLEKSPETVVFRVIRKGTLGPETQITAAKGRKNNLWTEDMQLYSEADRIWFVNTLDPSTLNELKLADEKKP